MEGKTGLLKLSYIVSPYLDKGTMELRQRDMMAKAIAQILQDGRTYQVTLFPSYEQATGTMHVVKSYLDAAVVLANLNDADVGDAVAFNQVPLNGIAIANGNTIAHDTLHRIDDNNVETLHCYYRLHSYGQPGDESARFCYWERMS